MNFKILKKDLKKKKSTNIILLIFVIMSSMFISSSIKNMTAIMNGMDYFMDKSEIADYIFLTMRENYGERINNDNVIDEFFRNNADKYDRYFEDDCIFLAKKNILRENGDTTDISTSIVSNSISVKQQKFFDLDDNMITDLNDGEILIPITIADNEKIEKGDILKIVTKNGYEKSYKVADIVKDAFLGSELMGTKRLVFSDNDFKELCEKSGLPAGTLYSVFSDDIDEFQDAYNKSGFSVIFGGDKKTVRTTYMMNMVVAGILLIVSACLILISIAMLRFIIKFSLRENFHEIGIMKAIGLKDRTIRTLNIVKYAFIAGIGSIIGFFAGFPFGKKLLDSVTRFMVVDSGSKMIVTIQFLASVVVAGVIILFAYLATKKVKKMTPMDAIRSGNNGENFHKKKRFFLRKTRMKPTSYMALNDVFREKKKYIALLITSIVGIWLLIMPINTVNTLTSDKMAHLFGIQNCDFFIQDEEGTTDAIVTKKKQSFVNYTDEIKKKLMDKGVPVEKVSLEVMLKYSVSKGDKTFKSCAFQGINTQVENYKFCEGTAPILDNEVAISTAISKKINADIGDTIDIILFNEPTPFVVTGLFESMTNMGEGIRFNEKTTIDYEAVSGCFSSQVTLSGEYTREELDDYMSIAKNVVDGSKVMTYKEYVSSMIGEGVSKTLGAMKMLIFVIVLIINILVVTLMQKMFTIREQGTIGMLKSIGFSNRSVVIWQTKRIAFVLFTGMLVGAATATPFSKLTSGQVFKIMGVQSIKFVVNPVEVYLIYPVGIFVITLLFCVLSMLKVKKISIREINNVE